MPDADTTKPDDDGETHEDTVSPSSQIGREETGGSDGSGREPGTDAREGWPMPDQSDTPSEWPEPTID